MRALCFLVALFAASAAVADTVKTFKDCPTCPEMVVIPAGSFVMGTPDSTRAAPNDSSNDKEKPARTIQMTSFSLGKYEVTQAEWVAVMGENPSESEGQNLPVDHVSWEMAQSFVEKLSKLTGKKYRLPSEAEWEYAARAGTSKEYYDSDEIASLDAYAWFGANSEKEAHAVGQKKPNRFGLYDMHGNVWEWTSDWYALDYYANSPKSDPKGPPTGTHHVLRGGSASVKNFECRCAMRGESARDKPYAKSNARFEAIGDFGLRVVCEIRK